MIKIMTQERVLELWKIHQEKISETLDIDTLLQILERYAEDELYFEKNIEIEQIEILISSENAQVLNQTISAKNTLRSLSIQRALRMSIFTIAEEEDVDDE